jgi:hypothetical protein
MPAARIIVAYQNKPRGRQTRANPPRCLNESGMTFLKREPSNHRGNRNLR